MPVVIWKKKTTTRTAKEKKTNEQHTKRWKNGCSITWRNAHINKEDYMSHIFRLMFSICKKKPYQLLSLLKYGIKMRHRGVDCGDIDASVCVLIVSYRSVIINALKALIILIWLTVESGVHWERRRVLSTKKPVWTVSYYACKLFSAT